MKKTPNKKVKSTSSPTVRILVVGDIHGKVHKIPKTNFDLVIAPGDFSSDRGKHFMLDVVRDIMKGLPPRNWYDIAGKKKALVLLRKSVRDGRRVLEHLNGLGVPVIVVPGNWDRTGDPKASWAPERPDYYSKMLKGLDNIIDVHERDISGLGISFIGYGKSNGPEWPRSFPKDYPKKKVAARKKRYTAYVKKLGKLFVNAKTSKQPVIFLTHNVPYNTPLDIIKNPDSPRNGMHWGSTIARELVLKHKPLLCIGGHMHEHFKTCKLGKTVCLNAGFGPTVHTIIEIRDGKIVSMKLHKK